MSVRFLNNSGGNNTNVSAKKLASRQGFTPVTEPWVRNPSWPAISANSGDNKIVGLYAVYPGDGVGNGGNFFAMTNSGAYTINYGDGTTTDYTSGSTAYYEFDYNDADLSGTDAPVTFTAATDTVNRTAHGYTNGDTVRFYNIVTTTGLSENTPYYVVNATANTFQVSTQQYNSLSVSAQETDTTGVFFKPDGTKMYIVGNTGDGIDMYDLSVAWDVSTATFDDFFSVATEEATPQDLFFKPDGTKMYVIGVSGDDVNEYELSTAWDISTASYKQVFSIATQETSPTGVFFKPDGTKMYVIGSTGDDVNEYTLSTAWDVSTATFVQSKLISAQETAPTGVFFKPDGTKMYVIGSAGDDVNEYTLSTAWDVSTASYLQNFVVGSNPSSVFFNDDGTLMYVVYPNRIIAYNLGTAWDISTATLALGQNVVSLTNDGSATLLPYKIAVVTITPQAGQNLTSVNFYVKHNQSGLANSYSTGWLDIEIALPSYTTLALGNSGTNVRHLNLEQVKLNQLGAITSFNDLFYNCYSLRNVVISSDISTVTSMNNMFRNCYSLTSVPLFNTAAVTSMGSMFSACYSLTSVPLFNTAAVTSMGSMFYGCYSLTSVPLFNTAAVTSMSSMFYNCNSLTSVPLFNTAAVNNMGSMFYNCNSLTSVPLFNTAAVNNMGSMFYNCYSLTSVPLFNTAAVTSMSSMFYNCYSLTSVPLFNTAAVTSMSIMFYNCNSLTSVPLFNTAAVTSMGIMFYNCYSLTSVPLFNTAAVIDMNSMFYGCFSLTSVPLFNTAAVIDMGSMFNGCYSLTSVPLFNTAAVTSMSSMFNSCFSLTSVPLFNTAAVTNMSSMFTNCYSLTSVPALVTTAVTSSSNFISMFNGCYSLARIQAKNFRWTFSVASCKLSATALNEIYTNLPTVTAQTITVTGNYGTATDDPTIATAKGWTVTG